MNKDVFERRFDLAGRDTLLLCKVGVFKRPKETMYEFKLCDGERVVIIKSLSLTDFGDTLDNLASKVSYLTKILSDKEDSHPLILLPLGDKSLHVTSSVSLVSDNGLGIHTFEVYNELTTVRFKFSNDTSRSGLGKADLLIFLSKLHTALKDSKTLTVRTATTNIQ